MRSKAIFWLIFIVVTALCWLDYQYFTEGHAQQLSPIKRQIGHLGLLAIITPVGYLGWKAYGISWIQKLWLVAYVTTLIIIMTVGLIQWKTNVFGIGFLDQISSLRLFFTSPLPYGMLYIINKVVQSQQNR